MKPKRRICNSIITDEPRPEPSREHGKLPASTWTGCQFVHDLSLTVNVWGHLSGGFGLGEGARCTVRSLKEAGIRVQLRDLPLVTHPNDHNLTESRQTLHNLYPAAIDLIHTNPNILQATDGLREKLELHAPLRIGFWAWELEDFPIGWESGFAGLDQIWCPSSFTATSIGNCSPVPVTPLPHLINWQQAKRIQQKRTKRNRNHPITCFFACDLWSTLGRKNPEGVISVFQEAFPKMGSTATKPHEARLLLKLSSTDQFPELTNRLMEKIQGDSRIVVITDHLSAEEMVNLWSSVDILIHLHRSEGFGLLMAEAMAAGIPVIATGYSGNLDYMRPGSAVLIPYQFTAINKTEGDYRPGWRWAEPDLEQAAKQLHHLATNESLRIHLGEQGYLSVKDHLSPARLARQVKQRLGCLLAWPGRAELLSSLADDHLLRRLESC